MNLFRDDPCFYWPEDLDIVWLGLWFLEGRIRFLKIGFGFYEDRIRVFLWVGSGVLGGRIRVFADWIRVS